MGAEYDLTKRELEICRLIAKGWSNEQIAKLLFIAKGTVKGHITSIYDKTGARSRVEIAAMYNKIFAKADTDMSDTSQEPSDPAVRADAKLLLAGRQGLPDVIPVIFGRRPFVIGRFDISVGRKQCDFEFKEDTKAVSRRHASIERTASGYAIVDLNSRAGTFVNGNRIIPGEQCPIRNGDRVSFGNLGADYVFDDNRD